MSPGDTLRSLLMDLLPPSVWRHHFGQWLDSEVKTYRFVVVRPAGGVSAELLRRPAFTVLVISGDNEPYSVALDAAELIVTTLRAATGELPYFEAGEPAFMATDDKRTAFQIAISTITD